MRRLRMVGGGFPRGAEAAKLDAPPSRGDRTARNFFILMIQHPWPITCAAHLRRSDAESFVDKMPAP